MIENTIFVSDELRERFIKEAHYNSDMPHGVLENRFTAMVETCPDWDNHYDGTKTVAIGTFRFNYDPKTMELNDFYWINKGKGKKITNEMKHKHKKNWINRFHRVNDTVLNNAYEKYGLDRTGTRLV